MRKATHAVPVGVLVAALLATPCLTTRAQSAATSQKNARLNSTGQLTLRNVTRDTLRVELRFGNATDCALNRESVTRVLAPGKRWLVAAPAGVCWRHQTVIHGASGEWAPWRRQVVSAGQRQDVALQEGT